VTADLPPVAAVGGRICTGLQDVTADLGALDSSGFWVVVLPYDGPPVCARFAHVRPMVGRPARGWVGPDPASWTSSLSQAEFEAGVASIRSAIAEGDVYQVNLTRRLSAPLPRDADVLALGSALAGGVRGRVAAGGPGGSSSRSRSRAPRPPPTGSSPRTAPRT
jgi:para-aminobenzoate synthetase component I